MYVSSTLASYPYYVNCRMTANTEGAITEYLEERVKEAIHEVVKNGSWGGWLLRVGGWGARDA